MRLLPDILDCSENGASLMYKLRIDADLAFFEGHFPDFPILPGVVQIDWAVELGKSLLDAGVAFQAMQRVKFMRPIMGGTELQLHLATDGDRRQLNFRYFDDRHGYSSGRMLFGR